MTSKNIGFAMGLIIIAVATGVILYSTQKKPDTKGPSNTITVDPSLVPTEEKDRSMMDDSTMDINKVDLPEEFLPSIEGTTPPKDTNTTPKSEATLPKTYTVTIQNFAFSPATITIKRGDKINFINKDSMAHTATGSGFDTGNLEENQSKTIIFNNFGSFDYKCTFHPSMKGTITVQ
ncbi:MAG: cupredoxin family copper-binding protein [Patescibacteria group bacterium]